MWNSCYDDMLELHMPEGVAKVGATDDLMVVVCAER